MTFLLAHGGYKKLASYQTTAIIYDLTVEFCNRYMSYGTKMANKSYRTYDQMVQAARSGKQNIAEGSQAAGTSRKTELKLLGVARASLAELLADYEDFLRQNRMRLWEKDGAEAQIVRGKAYETNRTYTTYLPDQPSQLPFGPAAAQPRSAVCPKRRLLGAALAKPTEGEDNGTMKKGFTLIEMVIVVTILGLLLVISMMSWRQQLNKARDAQRKEDLQRISIAFEEWFSDFGCYPDAAVLNNCGGPELMPYLAKIPCDPVTREPYQYIVDEDNPTCYENYKILALLANEADPAVADLGCGTDLGCGYDGAFNYGVSSKNVAVPSGTLPSPSPLASPGASASPGTSPSPSAAPAGNYYCQTIGNCTVYDPALWSCSPNYADPNCDNPTNPCISAGSCTRL